MPMVSSDTVNASAYRDYSSSRRSAYGRHLILFIPPPALLVPSSLLVKISFFFAIGSPAQHTCPSWPCTRLFPSPRRRRARVVSSVHGTQSTMSVSTQDAHFGSGKQFVAQKLCASKEFVPSVYILLTRHNLPAHMRYTALIPHFCPQTLGRAFP
ncbi:hypothetical protein BC834DRAFT_897418 [Gloeopeniophorella convolvens]|nr:hypothetical protein BC834DRAFT_897418 [Gloeopeniophorella convolvens]